MTHSPPRLLIVEDEPLLRDTLQQLLQISGFDAVSAADGQQALNVLASTPIDIVISDVKMPNMDGIELLKNIRARHSNLKLIFFSAFADISRDEAIRLGALDLLSKPVPLEVLINTIQTHLMT